MPPLSFCAKDVYIAYLWRHHDLTRPTRDFFRFHLTLVLLHYRAY
jgi:hypothetical protein